MPTRKPTDVDAYLAAQPPEVRAARVKVRAAMRRALPTSVEAIKYNMPTYLVDGRAVASFAGWKDHYALYIVSSTLFDAIREGLEGRDASKGIIRFNLNEPVPESVVVCLAEWNAAAVGTAAGGAKSRRNRKQRPRLAQSATLDEVNVINRSDRNCRLTFAFLPRRMRSETS